MSRINPTVTISVSIELGDDAEHGELTLDEITQAVSARVRDERERLEIAMRLALLQL